MTYNLEKEISQKQKLKGVPRDVIEKDYILSWILFGISNTKTLKETLVFKGGYLP
jgi:predicted nucleotidyltransferase component of viral defense system